MEKITAEAEMEAIRMIAKKYEKEIRESIRDTKDNKLFYKGVLSGLFLGIFGGLFSVLLYELFLKSLTKTTLIIIFELSFLILGMGAIIIINKIQDFASREKLNKDFVKTFLIKK